MIDLNQPLRVFVVERAKQNRKNTPQVNVVYLSFDTLQVPFENVDPVRLPTTAPSAAPVGN